MHDTDPIDIVARVVAFRHFCDTTSQTLDEFIGEMQAKGNTAVVFAASHLKDSLSVFTKLCEERLLQGDDI
jgi:hypothetical protein